MSTKVESLTGLRVLLVEDEILIAEELSERLERLGMSTVGIADTGAQAIRLAQLHEPELILMDIRLKGSLDGIDAAKAIREHVRAPVIFLTAHSDQDTLRRAKESQPFGYVLKPFDERDLVVAIEISVHRHGLEQLLKESEERYEATLASIGDGVIATDSEGRVTFLNPVAEALTGWNPSAARGLPIEQVLPIVSEGTRKHRESPALEAMRKSHVVHLDEPVLLRTRADEWIPIDDSAAPITDDHGRRLGAVVAFRDVRQRRLAEDALRHAEDQLRQAQKMEAIGRLAGGIAHDFNNLLTVVSASAELLLEDTRLDESSRLLVTEIKDAGERATRLTRQLLALSRKQVLEPVALQVGDLLGEISRMLQRLIGEDIALETRCAPDAWWVLADPGQVEQVVLNLAVNSRDAMPRGGRLTIETRNADLTESDDEELADAPVGRYVVLSVRDTGTGMEPALRDHVFEPFFTTKAQGEGTGLGLATVFGIVKQMNGFIRFDSEVGAGTTFEVFLPALREAPSAPAPQVGSKRSESRGNATILVVEDEDSIRALISTALRRLGYTVHEAGSGEEAFLRFTEHSDDIQLVVTDVVMRGMNGLELSQQIHAARPDLPVLFMSGYTDDTVIRHGVSHGEHPYLDKPFTLSALARKVRQVLDGGGSRSTP